ncbi:MAG: GAF domain-containing protein [Pyrinomonadaceae bacterium]|nr:GAF domain-containing protein [Pyrinomonadaceae bacterium]
MNLEEKLKAVVQTVDVADALTAPILDSITSLLNLAATALSCDESSIIVRDNSKDDGDDLRFLVAIGKVADKLRDIKIPSGKGIASFVYASGSPIVVADAARDSNFYQDVDAQTGYSTQLILATPLRFEGNVIGVLEFVNRIGEPPFPPFTADEMDKAALYADALATLVNAYESSSLIEKLFARMWKNDDDLSGWLDNMRSAPEHRELLQLAVIVQNLANKGANERRLCREIIEAATRFSDSSASATTSFLQF